jgi:GDP/UDP-N,N'-diacetylbacillosamine 2-epimerase (hydrolysing)
MRHAKVLVGNSSMGIVEAPYYKLPVVNLGNRQKGRINAGNVEFVTQEKGSIVKALEKACFDLSYRKHVRKLTNPYGDGSAARKILEAIESVDLDDSRWYVKRKLCP